MCTFAIYLFVCVCMYIVSDLCTLSIRINMIIIIIIRYDRIGFAQVGEDQAGSWVWWNRIVQDMVGLDWLDQVGCL